MNAACSTFYNIYKRDKCSDLVKGILEQLDFHPLSITLFATVAQQDKWGTDRLRNEWENHRTNLLQARHKKSFTSGHDRTLFHLSNFPRIRPRELLGVVAFFPQGVDILDVFCAPPLTYQSNRFVAALALLRDYLSPQEPKSSPLPRAAKECYFTRIALTPLQHDPGFG